MSSYGEVILYIALISLLAIRYMLVSKHKDSMLHPGRHLIFGVLGYLPLAAVGTSSTFWCASGRQDIVFSVALVWSFDHLLSATLLDVKLGKLVGESPPRARYTIPMSIAMLVVVGVRGFELLLTRWMVVLFWGCTILMQIVIMAWAIRVNRAALDGELDITASR